MVNPERVKQPLLQRIQPIFIIELSAAIEVQRKPFVEAIAQW